LSDPAHPPATQVASVPIPTVVVVAVGKVVVCFVAGKTVRPATTGVVLERLTRCAKRPRQSPKLPPTWFRSARWVPAEETEHAYPKSVLEAQQPKSTVAALNHRRPTKGRGKETESGQLLRLQNIERRKHPNGGNRVQNTTQAKPGRGSTGSRHDQQGVACGEGARRRRRI
jgi:hypothetical protein